ncbi:hypothetical protein ACDW_22890 [Acidovorax sp. DW039]|uniref:hypothetical protein n=1 Tax=Acidovorax sp. DW039 TaxID=3095606 RepID=UPI0030863D3F|nr:hypothetical protein ACDW_22890 [Acidovorax sp. DW039]
MKEASVKLACPVCSAELTFEQILGHQEANRTFDRLVQLSVPLANLVLQYLTLFTPPTQRLTNAKKLKLISQLLPGLEARSISFKGRDWDAPLTNWAAAIEQMLSMRANERITLPLSGHGYLFSILSGMTNKQEAAAEAQREQELRTGPRAATVNGPASVADLVQAPTPVPRPAAPAPARGGMSPTVRAMREQIAQRKGGENK